MNPEKQAERQAEHRHMRSLGMGKHTAGNAKAMAMHDIPDLVTVGESKTLGQWRAEQKAAKKKKNKLAKKSRRKNRR